MLNKCDGKKLFFFKVARIHAGRGEDITPQPVEGWPPTQLLQVGPAAGGTHAHKLGG